MLSEAERQELDKAEAEKHTEPYSIGMTHRRLARLCLREEQRDTSRRPGPPGQASGGRISLGNSTPSSRKAAETVVCVTLPAPGTGFPEFPAPRREPGGPRESGTLAGIRGLAAAAFTGAARAPMELAIVLQSEADETDTLLSHLVNSSTLRSGQERLQRVYLYPAKRHLRTESVEMPNPWVESTSG